MSLFYRAKGGRNWYEAAIVLYIGTPPATTDHPIADVHVVRGEIIADFKTESFTIQNDGHYFMAFYAGSYNQNGGENDIEASMTIGEVSISTRYE